MFSDTVEIKFYYYEKMILNYVKREGAFSIMIALKT